MSTRGDLLRGDHGQTLIEAALSLALLLTMLFGAIAGGMMLYTYHYLSFAARIASRLAKPPWLVAPMPSATAMPKVSSGGRTS